MDAKTLHTTDETVTTVSRKTLAALDDPKFRVNLASAFFGLGCILVGQQVFEDSLSKLFPAPDVKEYDPRDSPCYAGCADSAN